MKFSKETSLLLSNSLWSLIGTLISKGLMFLSWILVANILGKAVNGEIGVLRTTVNLFIAFAGNGFGVTLTKYLAITKSDENDFRGKLLGLSFLSALVFGLLICAVYYILTPWLSSSILNAPHLLGVLKLNTFLLFFSILNGVLIGCLQGFAKFKEISIVNSIYGVLLFLGLVYGAYNSGIYGVFSGFLIATIVSVCLSILYTYKTITILKIDISLKFKSQLTILRKFTLPAILTGLMVIPFKWFLETMLVREPSGYQEMGLFSAIFLFHTLVLMLANTVNAPFIVSMSNATKSKKMEKMNLLLPWGFSLIIITPILIFPELLGLLLDDEYLADPNFKMTTILICVITVLVLFKHGMARIMIINDLMWFSFFSNLIWGVALLLTFYFSSVKNASTISFSYVIAYVVNVVFVIPYYLKKNIIPRKIILSKNALVTWLLFGLLVVFTMFTSNINILIRLFILIIVMSAFSFNFYKTYSHD
ncbi:oligosaccharide flippase family protein [Winogradskyella alexanderae]|uniref:Oligosaccharide flippase family protein n=1 Tax=Winogradskyella alexanderae TaxID=2877123 RepID=A0ABS7XMR7_9FLAO|nr:oligosaccharide flippase family protein [Winogradskyella alexanderae]MCA0131293.1 oligosaccharide flippase family protein [Winogradskyella alexanderae]